MTKFEDNLSPYLTFVEQASKPAAPDADQERLYFKTDGKLYKENSSATETEIAGSGSSASPIGNNVLINGSFRFWQRQVPATLTSHNDDAYGPDRWYHLCEQASFQSARVDGNTQRYAAQLKNDNANAQQIGIAQIIEGVNCRHLRGKEVIISCKVKSSSTPTIRMILVEWTSTENAVTSDIISSWGSVPTLGANLNYPVSNATPGTTGALTGDTWTDLTYIGTLGSTFTNLIAFIYTDGQIAQNVTVTIEGVQLELGDTASAFELRSYTTELALCQRYYEKSSPVDTAPGTADGTSQTGAISQPAATTSFVHARIPWKAEKIAIPTVRVWSVDTATGAGTLGSIRDENAGSVKATSVIGTRLNCLNNFETATAILTVGRIYGFNYDAEAEL